jgi:hypothetical protein
MNFKILKVLILLLLAVYGSGYGQSVGSVDGVFNVSDMGAANR